MTVLATTADIRHALSVLGRHHLIDHQPDQTGRCPRCDEICPHWISAVRALRSAGWHLAVVAPHEPGPGWQCVPCDDAWPCSQARVHLGDRHGDSDALRDDLRRLMGHRMVRAAAELGVPVESLRLRFVGWV